MARFHLQDSIFSCDLVHPLSDRLNVIFCCDIEVFTQLFDEYRPTECYDYSCEGTKDADDESGEEYKILDRCHSFAEIQQKTSYSRLLRGEGCFNSGAVQAGSLP